MSSASPSSSAPPSASETQRSACGPRYHAASTISTIRLCTNRSVRAQPLLGSPSTRDTSSGTSQPRSANCCCRQQTQPACRVEAEVGESRGNSVESWGSAGGQHGDVPVAAQQTVGGGEAAGALAYDERSSGEHDFPFAQDIVTPTSLPGTPLSRIGGRVRPGNRFSAQARETSGRGVVVGCPQVCREAWSAS